jgi:hypothetical protein
LVFHIFHFAIKIERIQKSTEQQLAAYELERYLNERAEAHALEAAQLVTRI